MEYKTTPIEVKQIEGRTVTGFPAIFGNVDAGYDRVWKGAFKKTLAERGERIRHLWMHDASQPPTAAVRDIQEVGKADLPDDLKRKYPEATGGLMLVREYLNTPRADEILAGIQAGAINEMSFGYDPVKYDFEPADGKSDWQVRNLRELRLWDTSDVNWGMNEATVASKSAVPYADHGTADEGADWSKPAPGDLAESGWDDLSDAQKRRVSAHFAYTVNSPPEAFGDLKLPHHQASRSGVGPAVWNGVRAAMGALMGARGGVSIPDADRRSVYNHLAKHYAQFDKEPPDYKLLELVWTVRAAQGLDLAALKANGLLDGEDFDQVAQALADFHQRIATAEPEPAGGAQPAVDPLTEAQLAQRVKELQRYVKRIQE